LNQLQLAAAISNERAYTDLEKQGIIQGFEVTHELAWNVIKDYFEYQGNMSITGSRDASREAFQKKLIMNGDIWMEMIKSRNLTLHTYNKKIAMDIVDKTINQYLSEFNLFHQKMMTLKVRA
jgi:nucleotidyltransferase substrate binding protein (TIGR01987 family)